MLLSVRVPKHDVERYLFTKKKKKLVNIVVFESTRRIVFLTRYSHATEYHKGNDVLVGSDRKMGHVQYCVFSGHHRRTCTPRFLVPRSGITKTCFRHSV